MIPPHMSQVIIRRARRADLAELLDLYQHLNPNDPAPDDATAEIAWLALLNSGLTTVFVAEYGGALASSCMLAVLPNLTRNASSIGVIENVVTHTDHRRMGLGIAVLAGALGAAWDANCYKVMLATGSRRPETLRFYESAGFSREGKTAFEARRPQTA